MGRGANIHFETIQFYICFFIYVCFIMHLFYCLLYQLKYPCISSLPVKIPMMKKWLSERLLAEKIKTSKFSKWVLFDLLHIREVNIFDFCLMIVLMFFCTKKRWYVTFYFHILQFSLPLQFQSQMRRKNLGTVLFLHFFVVT